MLAETRDRYVYQIRASDDGRVVYIGMGKWKRCHCKHRKNLDINALIDAGGTLPVEIVAGPLSQADAWALEIELIAKHRRPVDGGTLLNRSTGGFGGGLGVNPSPETRARLRASNRSSSPEIRAKIAAALKGRPLSPEHRAKVGAHFRGKPLSAEHIAKVRAAKKGKPRKPFSPAHCAKLSAAAAGKPRKPHSLETRAKISAARRLARLAAAQPLPALAA